MLDSLKVILEMQEIDIKMIRLMRLKGERQKEKKQLEELKADIRSKIDGVQEEIDAIKEETNANEESIKEVKEKIKKLESQQDMVKKIDEF